MVVSASLLPWVAAYRRGLSRLNAGLHPFRRGAETLRFFQRYGRLVDFRLPVSHDLAFQKIRFYGSGTEH